MTSPSDHSYSRVCIVCSTPFAGNSANAKFCSEKCREEARPRFTHWRRTGLPEELHEAIKRKTNRHTCVVCSSEFWSPAGTAKYCSDTCRRAMHPKLERPAGLPPLATNTVGEIAKLRVIADLLRLGLSVFRAVSVSAPFDLAVFSSERKLLRVEVRTGYFVEGKSRFVTNRHSSSAEYDILAVVANDSIIYEPHPEIPVTSDFKFLTELTATLRPTKYLPKS